MSISRHHFQSLQNNVQKVVDQLSALEEEFEPDVEKGQYWDWLEAVVRVIDYNDLWVTVSPIQENPRQRISIEQLQKEAVLLSDDEAGQALIEEAERRGFEVGSNIIDANVGDNVELTQWNPDYFAEQDWLLCDGQVLYEKGQWAEIIEDEWDVVRKHNTGTYYVRNYNTEQVICTRRKNMNKEQAEAIADALNNMED